MIKQQLRTATGLVALLGLAACFEGAQIDSGLLNVQITDAPIDDAAAVVVVITAVEAQSEDGDVERFEFDEPRAIDLLALYGQNAEQLIQDEPLPIGDYDWLRLEIQAEQGVIDSYLELQDGSQYSLYLPDEYLSGTQTDRGFEMEGRGVLDFTIDFDLRKSVLSPRDTEDYVLRPHLRKVDNDEAGLLTGRVESDWVTGPSSCTAVVYLFEGIDAELGSEGSDNAPVTTSRVRLDSSSGNHAYTFGFLSPGEYTVAFTCDAALDNPEEVNELEFREPQNVTLEAGDNIGVSFPAPEDDDDDDDDDDGDD